MPPRAPRGRRPPARASREPSAPPTTTPDTPAAPAAEAYTPLQRTIATIFSQAQRTTAGHRKLVVNLRSCLDQCLTGTGTVGSTIGCRDRAGEKMFARDFCRFLNRVLVVKKSEVVGDRCLRLADLFVANLMGGGEKKKGEGKGGKEGKGVGGKGKVKALKDVDGDGDVEMDAPEEVVEQEEEMEEEPKPFEETSATRVVLRVLNHIVTFLGSKERGVRYRTAQFLALVLSNSLANFPTDYNKVSRRIFKQVHAGLTQRLHDKEAIVRVQAVIGLTRLLEMGVTSESDNEYDEDEDEEQSGTVELLIEIMQNDPSADVRRTILYNLSPTPSSMPYLLERSRDVDPATRRAVFNRLLPSLGDFRHLSIGMREKLLRWGLNDRDESVRKVAKHMFNFRWVDDAGGDLLEVLERLDVANESIEGGPKYMALRGFWENRKDVLADLTFDDSFWDNLTVEGSFLARSFNDYCRTTSPQEAKSLDVDSRMPEVTKLATYMQKYINKLVMALKNEDNEASDLEFIVQQLLLIAMTMDYGDEIGRRRMFALLRECLGIIELSEPVTKLIVKGIRKLSTGESDFCLLILEVIASVHDIIAEDEDDEDGAQSFHSAHSDPDGAVAIEDSMTSRPGASRPAPAPAAPAQKSKKRKLERSEDDDNVDEVEMMDVDEDAGEDDEAELAKTMKELTVNLKCLHIAQCMLENVIGGLKSNTHLVTMLNGLVVPAVRSHEAPVREGGLRCLGLSCLLDKTLAEENLTLFAHCFNKGHEKLQIEALHIISDILLTHGAALLTSENCSVEQRQLYKMLAKATKMDEYEEVQATAVEVICKLMLAQVIREEELLKVLVTSYFDPATVGNQSLRQTLSYFLPVFCHSASSNALMMARITVAEFHHLLTLRATLDDGEDQDMVSPTLIGAHFIDWTDPRKASPAVKEREYTQHAIVACDALERICSQACPKEERKLLVLALIAKCHIPKEAGKELLKDVYERVTEAIDGKVVAEAAARNALAKVESSVGKLLAELLEEEGGDPDQTVIHGRGDDGHEEEEEEDEEQEVDMTIVPEPVRGGEEDEELPIADEGVRTADEDEEEQEEREATPAVTEDEGDDE